MYTNNLSRMIKTSVVTVDISDHLATTATISLDLPYDRTAYHPATRTPDSETYTSRKFNTENNAKFRELIANEKWEPVTLENDADAKYNKFTDIYTKHYNTAYPNKKSKKRKNERKSPKPWILPWLEDACNRKNILHEIFVSNPTIANETVYKKMRKFCDKHVKKAKSKYYTKYFEQYKSDSRKQWSMINSLLNRRRKSVSINKLIDKDGNTASSPTQIAETFNNYFANIASSIKQNLVHDTDATNSNPSTHNTHLPSTTQNSIYLTPTEPSEISKYINDLKNKSTSDTKVCAIKIANEEHTFTQVLASVIDTSFSQGIFPQQLKLAKVIPIHKSGKKTEVSNYRPISLLSTFSKLYEKAMHARISNFLESNNSLFEMQFGFRKGRSCEHALLAAKNTILSTLNKNEIALLLLIDFSKAFDMVDHSILLDKLQNYGIRGIAHQWIKSYLTNREQYVHIKGKNSSTQKLEYGVPQGSILGPLLFVIYINDMPRIQCLAKFILYADDANIIITGQNLIEIEEKFSQLSTALVDWVACNSLSLNIKKTNYMIFSRKRIDNRNFEPKINNRLIEQKQAARFLGVILDTQLNWTHHIHAMKSKMARYLGILYKLRSSSTLPQAARITIFHSFIQSHLNYCSLIWGFSSKSNIELLFRAQKKGVRAIMPGYVNFFYKDGLNPANTKSTFTKHNIFTVQSLIVKNALIFMYKINNFPDSLPTSIVETISTNAPIIGSTHEDCTDWLSEFSYTKYQNSIYYKGPLLFTEIASANKNINLCYSDSSLKSSIKTTLREIQKQGDAMEWQSVNFKLYNISGLRKSSRIANLNSNC